MARTLHKYASPDIRERLHDQQSVWVYTLVDPRDLLPRYVGSSANVHERYKTHRRFGLGRSDPKKKRHRWIAHLGRCGFDPLLYLVERVDGATRGGHGEAWQAEIKWIRRFGEAGYPLLNDGHVRVDESGVSAIKR